MKFLQSIIFVALFALFWSNAPFAQMSDSLYKALPDSLKPKHQSALSGLEKQRILSYIDNHISIKNFEELDQITHSMENECNGTKDQDLKIKDLKSLADFYVNNSHSINSNNPNYQHKALSHYKAIINLIGTNKIYFNILAQSYQGLSNYYLQNHRYDSLAEYLHLGLEVAKIAGDTDVLVRLNQDYALMYSQLYLPKLAILYNKEALRLYPAKRRWDDEYTRMMINAAIHYLVAFRVELKDGYRDSALYIIHSVMAEKKTTARDWYGACYYTLGLAYARNEEYRKALLLFDSSMSKAYNQTSKYWVNYQYSGYIEKAACLIKLGNYKEGKKLMDSVKISKTDFRSARFKADALYQYAMHINDWKAALNYYKEYVANGDSLNMMAYLGKVFESEQQYQALQKEGAIEKLKNENLEVASKRRGMVAIFLIALLLLGTFFFLFYMKSKRQLKKSRR